MRAFLFSSKEVYFIKGKMVIRLGEDDAVELREFRCKVGIMNGKKKAGFQKF
jgi:hypothetical protein